MTQNSLSVTWPKCSVTWPDAGLWLAEAHVLTLVAKVRIHLSITPRLDPAMGKYLGKLRPSLLRDLSAISKKNPELLLYLRSSIILENQIILTFEQMAYQPDGFHIEANNLYFQLSINMSCSHKCKDDYLEFTSSLARDWHVVAGKILIFFFGMRSVFYVLWGWRS